MNHKKIAIKMIKLTERAVICAENYNIDHAEASGTRDYPAGMVGNAIEQLVMRIHEAREYGPMREAFDGLNSIYSNEKLGLDDLNKAIVNRKLDNRARALVRSLDEHVDSLGQLVDFIHATMISAGSPGEIKQTQPKKLSRVELATNCLEAEKKAEAEKDDSDLSHEQYQ